MNDVHQSALELGKEFFKKYCAFNFSGKIVVDIGALDVNGSLRDFCPVDAKYIGVDFVEGRGVDVILSDPYHLPFDNEFADVVVCSSVLEHSEFFWLLFLEGLRILKPHGLFYINAPSNGKVHRYPIDGWRFYPDAGLSLAHWAQHNSYSAILLESFIANKVGDIADEGLWNDFVAVFVKDGKNEHLYPLRIQEYQEQYFCGYSSGWENVIHLDAHNPDYELILKSTARIKELSQEGLSQNAEIAILSATIESLTAQSACLSAEIEKLTAQSTRLSSEAANLSSIIDQITSSTSWRLTAPLRRVANAIKKRFSSCFYRDLAMAGSRTRRAFAIYKNEGLYAIFRICLKKLGYSKSLPQPFKKEESFKIFSASGDGSIEGVSLNLEAYPDLKISRSREYVNNCGKEHQGSVGIFVHAYYPDRASELLDLILPLNPWESLFLTTDTTEKKQELEKILQTISAESFQIKITANVGRDIAPRFVSCKEEISKFDIVIFLHTKKSPHLQSGNEWCKYLWLSTAGTPCLRKNIRSVFIKNPSLGILAPHHWPELIKNQPINWGFNLPIAQRLVERAGGELLASTPLDFPSGSMFWARSNSLSKLMQANFQNSDFGSETSQVDGTLAHGIERSFFFMCELAGYRWMKYQADLSLESREPPQLESSPNLLFNCLDYGLISARYPESALIPFSVPFSHPLRLNLLIPTLRKAHVFGGIKTAITLFGALVKKVRALEPDALARIIVTDDMYLNSDEFIDSGEISNPDNAGNITIFSVADRGTAKLANTQIGRNDHFFASAWWNARQIHHLQKAQNALFGKEGLFFYLIQDYEPGFYAWSTKSALAEETYRSRFSTFHIINDKFLFDFFDKYRFKNKVCLNFSVNDELKDTLKKAGLVRKDNILVFYGRPSVERNCFELLIDAIQLWASFKPNDFAQWTIYSAGESYSSDLLPPALRKKINILGKLSITEYANLLMRAKVGISLMQSPHPSYPPQEMAGAGLVVVTNDWQEKKWGERHGTYIPTSLDVDSVCKGIMEAANVSNDYFSPESLANLPSQREANEEIAAISADFLIEYLSSDFGEISTSRQNEPALKE